MPEMKVTSIRLVKASDVPQRTANTAMSRAVADIIEHLKEKGAPKKDSAYSVEVDYAKKYTRYQLQKRLQKAGHKVSVHAGELTAKSGMFFIVAAE
jgi:hypothetical protein